MELTDLKLFERVAREGAIARAAAALHMAQPAVSERLQRLEAEVGRPLLRRHARGVVLTPEGEAFLDYVQRALRLVAEGTDAARTAGGEPTRINLAAPASVNAYFLPPLLRHLSDAGYHVSAYDAHSSHAIQLLLDGAIHAAFVLGAPGQPGLKRQVLVRDPIVCVAAPGHPLASRSGLCLADVAEGRLVRYNFSGEADGLFNAIGPAQRGAVAATPAEAARALVLGGDFVTFLPAMTVAADLAAGRLVALQLADMPHLAWEIAVIHRDRKGSAPAVAALLEAVRALWGAGTPAQ